MENGTSIQPKGNPIYKGQIWPYLYSPHMKRQFQSQITPINFLLLKVGPREHSTTTTTTTTTTLAASTLIYIIFKNVENFKN
jgi:hypothetical protein